MNFILDQPGKYAFNVGRGVGISVLNIINAFEKANNIKIKYKIGPRRKGDIEQIWSDCSLINKKLNWFINLI